MNIYYCLLEIILGHFGQTHQLQFIVMIGETKMTGVKSLSLGILRTGGVRLCDGIGRYSSL